jgi:AraC-like DNA-binding protein
MDYQSNQIFVPALSARAPRVVTETQDSLAQLYPAPTALSGAIVAVVTRNTCGIDLSDAQRLSHFPASPFVCLSWYSDTDFGLVTQNGHGTEWRRLDTNVLISGSQSGPTASWSRGSGRGGMIYFPINTATELFQIDVSMIQDRAICARRILGTTWFEMLDALVDSDDDQVTLEIIERYLEPRWRPSHPRHSTTDILRGAGRQWVDGLARQANEWQRSRGTRQVERRIKALSGRSLREWQSLVGTEQAFFAARDRQESIKSLDWAAFALEAGFADQAHLSRAVKRITGFPPAEFARRFVEDESFWIYRLWV